MSLELGYERLAFVRREIENASDTVVEGSVTLPEGSPEVGRALQLRATPRVSELEVKEDKVIFEGVFDLDLLYVHVDERAVDRQSDVVDEEEGEGEEDEDEFDAPATVALERLAKVGWSDELPFAFVLELPGIEEGAEVETDVAVETVTYDVRSDQVTLDVDIGVRFHASVSATDAATVATGVRGAESVDVATRPLRVRNHLGAGSGEGGVEAELPLAGRSLPESIIDVRATTHVAEVSVEDGSATVRGSVAYEILYSGSDGAGPQCAAWPRAATFELHIPVDGARRGSLGVARVDAGESRCSVVESDEGRRIDVETPLAGFVEVVLIKELGLVTGLTSEEREVAARSVSLSLPEAVGEGKHVERSDAALDLPEGSPGVERVLRGNAVAAVDDVHVLGDRVAVELHVDVELLYVGRDQADGVYTAEWPGALTLDLEVPVPGAEPGLERSVDVRVERVEFDPINRESLDVSVELAVDVALHRDVECEVVAEAVELPPVQPNPPTYTFVVAEPGDTLWKVAARYRSQADAILSVNPWLEEQDESIPVGRKLCVPRKTYSEAG